MSDLQPSVLSQIPRGVWVLGFVSLLMDISSEMIHSLLPMYLVTVLGTSAFVVGLIVRILVTVTDRSDDRDRFAAVWRCAVKL